MTTAKVRSWVAIVALAGTAAVAMAYGAGRHGGTAEAATPKTGTVTVSGAGTVQGVPDTLTASFDVHVSRGSVQGAIDADATAAHRLLAALRRAGVGNADVQTASFSLGTYDDQYGHLAGYQADETVTAKIHPLRNAGAAISAAAGASGNDVTVNGFSLDIGDDAALVAAARRQAFASARSAADEYAGLAGRRLGPVVTVSETVQHSEVPIDPKLAGAAGAAAPLPVQPGRQPVTVEVTVEWSLG